MREEPAFRAGEMVPGSDFKIVRPLGQGGMGSVYEVEDVSVGRRFVLKTIHLALLNRKDLLARFEREARILAQLNHPNIVEVITFKWTTDTSRRCYYVMEKLNGRNLRHVLRERGALALDRALGIAVDLFDAIDHAHDHRVIHRDIKPENIFLHKNRDGTIVAKLLDFGVMKLVEGDNQTAGRFVGTVRYAAPEQLDGWGVDKKSDLYAGGLVLFELIAGRGPFDDVQGDAVIEAHRTRVPPRLSEMVVEPIPRRLDDLVASLLAKELKDRPASALDVANVLRALKQELLGDAPALAPADDATSPDMVRPSHIPTASPSAPSLGDLHAPTAKDTPHAGVTAPMPIWARSGEMPASRVPTSLAEPTTPNAMVDMSNPPETRAQPLGSVTLSPSTVRADGHGARRPADLLRDAVTGSLPCEEPLPTGYGPNRTEPIDVRETFRAPGGFSGDVLASSVPGDEAQGSKRSGALVAGETSDVSGGGVSRTTGGGHSPPVASLDAARPRPPRLARAFGPLALVVSATLCAAALLSIPAVRRFATGARGVSSSMAAPSSPARESREIRPDSFAAPSAPPPVVLPVEPAAPSAPSAGAFAPAPSASASVVARPPAPRPIAPRPPPPAPVRAVDDDPPPPPTKVKRPGAGF